MSIKLKRAQEHFSKWHSLGKHKGRASRQLMREAVALLSEHPLNKISDLLQVSVRTLNNWRHAVEGWPKEFDFVSLPTVKSEILLNEESALHLTLPHGIGLSIKGQSIEKSVQLIRSLLEELKTCSI